MAARISLVSRLLERLGSAGAGVDQRLDPVQAARPLHATRFVALDLETTGLDPRRDAVVQVAMIGIDGLTIEPGPLIHTLIAPQRPIPPAATRIHGISDADVRGAPTIDRVLPRIAEAWRDVVVVGHHVRFDLAILATAARRGGHTLPRPPFLDTWALSGALDARLAHLDLADTARHFGIQANAFARHDALADASLAAHLFVRLAERLVAIGEVTVGQAAGLAERCRLRQ